MSLPKCGAKTKRGTPCQCVAVRGVGRCKLHGGGKALRKRYAKELRETKSPRRRDWLLRQLDRSIRNRETEYHKSGNSVSEATADTEILYQHFLEAVRDGRTTMKARQKWIAAVKVVRSHRIEFALPAIYEALLGWHGDLNKAIVAVAGSLALSEQETAVLREEMARPAV